MFDQIRKFMASLTGEKAQEEARSQLSQLSRPAVMSRRGFLQVVGITTTTVCLGEWSPPPPCPYDIDQRAMDAMNNFTRTKMREDGFFRQIMPPVPIAPGWTRDTVTLESPKIAVAREETDLVGAKDLRSLDEKNSKLLSAVMFRGRVDNQKCTCGKHKHLENSVFWGSSLTVAVNG